MLTDGLSQAAWVGIVQQLCDYLQENKDKIQFLKQIDNIRVNPSLNLEEFIAGNMGDLVRFLRATNGHFYLDSGNELLLLHTTDPQEKVKRSFSYDVLSSILPVDQQQVNVIEKSRFKQFFKKNFSWASSLLFIPIWFSDDHIYPLNRLGMIIFETQDPEIDNHFRDQVTQSFAHTVAGQLALGLQFRLQTRQDKWFQNVMISFFRLDLEPYKCFEELTHQIPDFLSFFGSFKSKPKVQILTYNAQGKYLTIVGTTAGEVGTRVEVKDSVVGLLFEETGRSYVLGNPKNDPLLKSRYKAYIDKKERTEIQTELAVPIENSEGNRFAAINLETEFVNAFSPIYVKALINLCNMFAPMIATLYDSIIERQRQQSAVMHAQRSYWKTVGSILRHNTNSQLASIRMGIDNAKMAVELNKTEKIKESLIPAYSNLIMVAEEIKQFSEKIYTYSVYGDYLIRELISEAIFRIKERITKEKKTLVDFVPGQDFHVFCSPTFIIHFYNILNNSIYWMTQRLLQESNYQPKISIRVAPGPLPDKGGERELNQTCEVVIEDNGLGCPKVVLDRLLHQPVISGRIGEQKRGYALYALANDVYGINGSVKVESEEGYWFRTTIHLPVFDSRIHQAKSSI
ncbi:MAG: sensor histidine kinase [Anaerolineae bacterium]|nr:sensor histidine kinase [Anaerolineae bacterium]